jgi:hypothetical protein
MKTVSVMKTGVDLSDDKIFGDVKAIAGETRFLIRVKQPDYYNIEYSLRYRKTDDGFIQLIMVIDEEPLGIVGQFPIDGETRRMQLGYAIMGYIYGISFWWGFPKYLSSPIVKESELDDLVRRMRAQRDANYAAAVANKPALIRLLEKESYRSVPDYWRAGTWFANCPGPGEPHTIHISTVANEWECTRCKRKGDGRAFTRWLKEIKRLNPGVTGARADRLNGTNIVFKE